MKDLNIGDAVVLNIPLYVYEMTDCDKVKRYMTSNDGWAVTANKSIFGAIAGIYVGSDYIRMFDNRLRKQVPVNRLLHGFLFDGKVVYIDKVYVDVISRNCDPEIDSNQSQKTESDDDSKNR